MFPSSSGVVRDCSTTWQGHGEPFFYCFRMSFSRYFEEMLEKAGIAYSNKLEV